MLTVDFSGATGFVTKHYTNVYFHYTGKKDAIMVECDKMQAWW